MAQQIKTNIADLLKSYSVCSTFLRSQEYAKEYFDTNGTLSVSGKEDCGRKMKYIESLIEETQPSQEGTLLHLHYIKSIPVEKCAECMRVSRRTAYRLLNRAHEWIFYIIKLKKIQMEVEEHERQSNRCCGNS